MNARVLCFEKTEFIISIDNIDLPSIANSSTMTTPEVAITELPDTPQKKKPKNMANKELEVEVTYEPRRRNCWKVWVVFESN